VSLAALLLLATLAALALAPARAQADNAYVRTSLGVTGWGSGEFDESGTMYIPSNSKTVRRYAKDGTALAAITTPYTAVDVAPSPDGQYVYYSDYTTIRRMVRAADGSYSADTAWAPAQFVAGGTAWTPKSRWVSTDAYGYLYISNGGWQVGNPNMILKYAPSGALVTQFGDYGQATGQFDVNQGLAVSRDGRRVYTVEQTMGRVQEFDWGYDGSYHFTRTWGTTDTNNCSVGNFVAPYDVGLDPWGFVYVSDTTCRRVQKFTDVGVSLGTIDTWAPSGSLNHPIGVDAHGNVMATEIGYKIVRAASNPEPGAWPAISPPPAPDATAPSITGVTVPATTNTRAISVTVTVSDDVGVDKYRLAGEDGNFGAWQAWSAGWKPGDAQVTSATVPWTISAGYGSKAVTVQVEDSAGHDSTYVTRTLSYVSADTVAPTLSTGTIPAATTTQTITVSLAATDDVAVTEVQTANEDGNWGAWRPYAASIQQTLTAGYGTKGVSVRVRDAAGNVSGSLYRTTSYSADAPPAGGGGGGAADGAPPIISTATVPALTSVQTITVHTVATDDVGVARARFANEDGVWSGWRAFSTDTTWTLSAGYGSKAVFVQVADASGKTSNVVLVRTSFQADAPAGGGGGGVADATAPVLTDVQVPALTPTNTITATIAASDNVAVAQARFATESGVWGPWQPFAAQMQVALSPGTGAKALFTQVRDAAGNESAVALRRTSVQADAPPPGGGGGGAVDAADPVIQSVTLPATVPDQAVTVGLLASDDVGVAQVRLANEDGVWAAWQAFQPNVPWMLSAGKTYKVVFAQVRDASGRESNTMYARTQVTG
jgi:hypothetical protein